MSQPQEGRDRNPVWRRLLSYWSLRKLVTADSPHHHVDDPASRRGSFVAHSEITVPSDGVHRLRDAFAARLHEVEDWPGFNHLEVWQDERDETRFVMVSWWDAQSSFAAYMRSDSHRRSHARIPGGSIRPRPAAFSRYRVVSR